MAVLGHKNTACNPAEPTLNFRQCTDRPGGMPSAWNHQRINRLSRRTSPLQRPDRPPRLSRNRLEPSSRAEAEASDHPSIMTSRRRAHRCLTIRVIWPFCSTWTAPFSTSLPPRARSGCRRRFARRSRGFRICTGGALAFVSGRPVNELDLIFTPLQLPAVGGHGAEIRVLAGTAPGQPRIPPLEAGIKRKFAEIAKAGPGIIIEDKGYSLALHYRLAPDKEDIVLRGGGGDLRGLAGHADRAAARKIDGRDQAGRLQQGFGRS